jgi:dTDP-4-dehydrorhamnose 3,5-epimerase
VKILPLAIEGAWEIVPAQHGDPRGVFLEWYRSDRIAEAVGHQLQLAQANISVSARGVIRGIHFAEVPPGQAKYVTCVRGAVLDVIVDLRTGSPTFGEWQGVLLDDADRQAVYIAEGLGHGFCALSDGATVAYLCSELYAPDREHSVDPLDADLGIEWPTDSPIVSDRDGAALTLAAAADSGLLPTYAACLAWAQSLDSDPSGLP